MMKTLYLLRLQHGKYYVGTTGNLTRRYQQHKEGTGKGAYWTKKYRVLDILEQRPVPDDLAPFEETKLTLSKMLEHGHNNVRGAEYCQLREYTIEEIAFKIAHHLKMEWKDVETKLAQLEQKSALQKETLVEKEERHKKMRQMELQRIKEILKNFEP